MSPRLFFRTVAIAEAITWTGLIAGMLLKYVVKADFGQQAVSIAGGLHGFVFIAFGMTVLLVGVNQRWNFGLLALGIASAVIPYAAVAFDIWTDKTGRLNGPWRRVATEDPRDHTWYARLLRWMLRHPVLLAVGFVVVLVAVFTVLLIGGPPV